ncbi:MAG: hypothetical protein ABJN40_06035 [Sneathiella sp.]
MRQNPYSGGYQTPIGSALGNLVKGFFGPQNNNQARDRYYNAQANQVRSEMAADAKERSDLQAGKGMISEAFKRGYGELEEAPRSKIVPVGPMPRNTREEQLQQQIPNLGVGASLAGVDAGKIGKLINTFIQNGATHGDIRHGAFVGSGEDLGKIDGARAVFAEERDRLIQDKYAQEAAIQNRIQAGHDGRNDADNIAAESRNNADNLAAMARVNAKIAGRGAAKPPKPMSPLDQQRQLKLIGDMIYNTLSAGQEAAEGANSVPQTPNHIELVNTAEELMRTQGLTMGQAVAAALEGNMYRWRGPDNDEGMAWLDKPVGWTREPTPGSKNDSVPQATNDPLAEARAAIAAGADPKKVRQRLLENGINIEGLGT